MARRRMAPSTSPEPPASAPPPTGVATASAVELLAARPRPEPPLRLDAPAVAELLGQLPAAWSIREGMLRREFARPDYASGVQLVAGIGALADQLNHHPELLLKWGSVGFAVNTHDVDGLSALDFILAAKVELLAAELAASPPAS